jgi:hypothetical protein
MSRLTGNIRYRIENRWFRHPLVVVECEINDLIVSNNAGIVDTENVLSWVDMSPDTMMNYRGFSLIGTAILSEISRSE